MKGYLVGCVAVDVARITRLPLSSSLHRLWDRPDIAAEAVRATDHVFLDLTRLDAIDCLRVALTCVAINYFIDQQEDACSSESGCSSSRGSSVSGFVEARSSA